MADQSPKRKMSVAQRVFFAGVKYGYRRALQRQRAAAGMLEDEQDEVSAAETLRQALDSDDDPDSGPRLN
jgi:hypothetical protein